MSTNAPNTLISLINEPLMAEMLGVKVVDFKAGMMDMLRLIPSQKQGMVIYRLAATVNVHENADVFALTSLRCVLKEVRWDEVEVGGVPRE